jgi:hypothetical protein
VTVTRLLPSLCENCLCPLADARGSVTTITESAAYGAATVRKGASPGFFSHRLNARGSVTESKRKTYVQPMDKANGIRLANLCVQHFIRMCWIASNQLQIRFRWLIRFRSPLFPISKGAQRNMKPTGELLSRQLQSSTDDLRLWRSPHALEVGIVQRMRIAIFMRSLFNFAT